MSFFLPIISEDYVRVWKGHCVKCGWRMKEFDRYKNEYNQLTSSACEEGDSQGVRGVCDQCGIENTRYVHNWHPVPKEELMASSQIPYDDATMI